MIIAPNHFSFLDHFFVAVFLRRKVHFMAKSQLFKRPMQFVYHHGGVFPVRRGHHDEEAFKTAHAILGRGDMIVMYAEARPLAHAASSASRATASAGWRSRRARRWCPTAIAGTERARNWKRLQFPKVTIQFGEPIQFEQVAEPTREQAQAASEIVFERVREMHTRLVGEGRKSASGRARRPQADGGGVGSASRFALRANGGIEGVGLGGVR